MLEIAEWVSRRAAAGLVGRMGNDFASIVCLPIMSSCNASVKPDNDLVCLLTAGSMRVRCGVFWGTPGGYPQQDLPLSEETF